MSSRRNSLRGMRHNVRAINRAAFTLVELLVVVVIAIILMAVTLPTIKYNIEETKVREAARQVNSFFASAKAQATATGRYAGVWLELERVGDPTTPLGVYQCTQLYLAEVQSPYCGDVLNARCQIAGGNPPWALIFPAGTADSLPGLVPNTGDTFLIRFDYKGPWFLARRTASGFEIPADFGTDSAPGVVGVDDDGNGQIDGLSEIGFPRSDDGPRPPLVGSVGPDGERGAAGTDDDGIGGNNSPLELNWPLTDDIPYPFTYQIQRPPQRVGQPLELPQGVVLDMSYSGVGPIGYQFEAARERVLVLFDPTGGVSSVTFVHQQTGTVLEDTETSKLFLLLGRAGKVESGPAFTNVAASNLADGSNMWIAINRRNGSVATVENVPDFNPNSYAPAQPFPPTTLPQRLNFIARSREFAAKGDVKGGQ